MSFKLNVEDRAQITELLSRYCWVLDVGDLDNLQSVFTPDAVFIINGRIYDGLEAIHAYFLELVSRDNWAGTQHYNSQVILEAASETRCEMRSYCTVVFVLRDVTSHFRMLANYQDTCVKLDGDWLIEKRIVSVWNPSNPS
jgi:hypothetical protein